MKRRRLTALLLTLALLLASMPLSFPVSAASPDIVISQVYGGGGNSNAPFRNDYVELFNRGDTAVSLAGWSLQYTSSSGTTWGSNKVALSGTVQPGQYFLVQLASQSSTGAALPSPDLSPNTINMSATAGKIALVRTTANLAGNCPSGGDLVDLVGFGGADCGEGGTKAPTLSNTEAAIRLGNGCQDTDSNAADFAKGAPAPRNSGSPVNPCGASKPPTAGGQAAPSMLFAGDTTALSVAVTPGANPTSTGISVTVDLTAIGGAAGQAMTNGGNGTFTYEATVAPGTQAGDKALPVTVTDAQGRTASTDISLTVLPPVTATEKLLISELLVDPATSNEPEEFIRIYNPGTAAVSLAGWSISSITGSTGVVARATFPPGAAVGAGQSVVATMNGAMYRKQVDPYATADRVFEYGETASGFGTRMTRDTVRSVALSNTAANVILRDAASAEVDVVRYVDCSTTQGVFTCVTPPPYAGAGWSGPVITWPQTQGYSTTHIILARAIDEATITATSAGTYGPDTNTAIDWLAGATDSAGGWNYWQGPGSSSATPMSNRLYRAGQMQSLPLPTWEFDGTVTAFMAPDNAYNTIAALFDSATTSIDLNMYEFQLVDLAEVLVQALQRGVAVRVLLEGQPCCENRINDQTRYIATLLQNAGAQVRYVLGDNAAQRYRRYDNVNHAKYAIVDLGTAGARLMVFSGNFKKSSSSMNPAAGNRDWGIIIGNQDAAAYYKMIFDYDFDPNFTDSAPYGYMNGTINLGAPAAGFQPDRATTSDPDGYYAHPFSARTVTGSFKVTPVMVPETAFLNHAGILGMVKNATSEVLLEWATLDPYWGSFTGASSESTPVPLVQELLNAARRGVAVRVILDGKYDKPGDAKSNAATVAYLNSRAQAEGLTLVAKIMKFTVIRGYVDSDDYLIREYPGYNEIHNKGIVVDGRKVLVSSINGTQASWLRNREAALIVENEEIGRYYGDAFWYDWYDGAPSDWPVISELQYDPIGADEQNEWLELYNPTGAAIDLTGWSLANKNAWWPIPAGTVLPAGGTLTFARTDEGFRSQFGFFPDVAGVSLLLVNAGDTLRLVRPNGSEADRVSWQNFSPDWQIAAAAGQSLIRSNACKDTNSRLDWANAVPQPGTATCNGTTPPPPGPAAILLLSEVQYDSLAAENPEPDEYVEIYNAGATAADLSAYQLVDNSATFKLPSGTTLAAGAYLTVTRDGAAFAARYGRPAGVTGMTLQLGNSGDKVTLKDARGRELDMVAWESFVDGWTLEAPSGWAVHHHGGGKAAADWVAGDATPGSGIPSGLEGVVSVSPASPDGANGWYLSPVTAYVASSSWGAVSIEMSTDGVTWSPVASRSSGGLPMVYEHTVSDDVAGVALSFRVTDVLGRQTVAAAPSIRKDATAPVVSVTGVTDGAAIDGAAEVVVSAADAMDAAPVVTAKLNGAPFAGGLVAERGAYTLVAGAQDEAGNRAAEQQVSFSVYHTPVVAVVTVVGVFGHPLELSATLSDAGAPVAGATLSFLVDGQAAGTAVTGADGGARVAYTPQLPAGAYTVLVTLAEDASLYLRGASGSGTLVVNPATFSATYTGSTLSTGQVSLSASLLPAWSGVPVLFRLSSGDTYVAVTDGSGRAQVSAAVTPGIYMVSIASGDESRYLISGAPVELVVYDPGGTGSVSGGGWVQVGGEKVNLSIQKGSVQLNNLGGQHLQIKELDWLIVSGSTAVLQGRAGGYTVRITVTDGQPDRVSIRVTDGSGAVVISVEGAALEGGELKVR